MPLRETQTHDYLRRKGFATSYGENSVEFMSWKKHLQNQLYDRDGTKCHYCGIEEDDFVLIWGDFYGGKRRGRRLEVDRRDNGRGYEIENCVLACAVCNNAKSDKFTYEEFKRVGAVIKEIWQQRKVRLSGRQR